VAPGHVKVGQALAVGFCVLSSFVSCLAVWTAGGHATVVHLVLLSLGLSWSFVFLPSTRGGLDLVFGVVTVVSLSVYTLN
jgi:hypothetical protein